ncbi:growth-regulating factor 8-like [Bidens hawaiensis]|uniref:growth-regulating factor 8-like n=1 Tax=Bidens hawaiensis TaxID=980011 RepID=UPI00404AB6BE
MSSNEYNTGGHGWRSIEKSGKAPSQAAECDVELALNMQATNPVKKMSSIFNQSLYDHYPQHQASIDFGGDSNANINQIASGTSFTGGETHKWFFTASQLQEFENQTMIYKHIMSSIPIPPQLLLPLSTQYNRLDSEPWRCRRTDGKKWRCSRDVMPDQKYCERHAHKNRPARSRKPVETQSQNTKNINSIKDHNNYHPLLPPTTSCQQSRWVFLVFALTSLPTVLFVLCNLLLWGCFNFGFMKLGATIPDPVSSSHQKIQKSMPSPSVGSKRDHFFQNLEGCHDQDLVQGDNCSLTLMQPGGDQDLFHMGTGMLNADGYSNPQNKFTHHGSWLGGPLAEALCPRVVTSPKQPTNVQSPNDSSHGLC